MWLSHRLLRDISLALVIINVLLMALSAHYENWSAVGFSGFFAVYCAVCATFNQWMVNKGEDNG